MTVQKYIPPITTGFVLLLAIASAFIPWMTTSYGSTFDVYLLTLGLETYVVGLLLAAMAIYGQLRGISTPITGLMLILAAGALHIPVLSVLSETTGDPEATVRTGTHLALLSAVLFVIIPILQGAVSILQESKTVTRSASKQT